MESRKVGAGLVGRNLGCLDGMAVGGAKALQNDSLNPGLLPLAGVALGSGGLALPDA